jgi:DNA-binding NtrC family response regulator
MLIDVFLDQINADSRGKPEVQEKKISENARKLLIAHAWPGNIRELYHSLLRASIWSTSAEIQADDIQSTLLQIQRKSENVLGRPITQGFDLQGLLDEISRHYIDRALGQSGHRKSSTAKLLGFANHQTLANWMRRLGLETEEHKD